MGSLAEKLNRRSLKWIVFIVLMLLAAMGMNLALSWVGSLPGVAFKTIKLKGTVNHVSRQALEAVAKRTVHGNFFTVDMKSVQVEFEKVTWVRAATVRRVWPDRLEVTLEEHVPFARWGTDAMLNTYGEVFRAGYAGELPRFVGPLGSEREVVEAYRGFREILAKAELQPWEVLLSARRAWQVKLTNGMVLDLGRVDMDNRLARFVAVNKWVPELQERKGRADLRYPNGFALKLTRSGMAKQEIAKTRK